MAAIRKQVPQKHLYKLHMQQLYNLWKETLDLLQAKAYDTAAQNYHGNVQLPGLIAFYQPIPKRILKSAA